MALLGVDGAGDDWLGGFAPQPGVPPFDWGRDYSRYLLLAAWVVASSGGGVNGTMGSSHKVELEVVRRVVLSSKDDTRSESLRRAAYHTSFGIDQRAMPQRKVYRRTLGIGLQDQPQLLESLVFRDAVDDLAQHPKRRCGRMGEAFFLLQRVFCLRYRLEILERENSTHRSPRSFLRY